MTRTFEEEFLYALMGKMYELRVPVVFKGAMVLRAVQHIYGNPTGLIRETHDVDGDWIGDIVNMEDFGSTLQRVVNEIQTNCKITVELVREYGENRSAGFNFVREDGARLTSMDLSIKKNNYYRIYEMNGVSFCGQTVDKILVDKIYVCSTRKIFRRIKDVIDIYILSYCWKGSYLYLLSLSEEAGRAFENFEVFTENFADFEHAYQKCSNSVSGGDFKDVYKRVSNFLVPFVMHYKGEYYWNGSVWTFEEMY